MGPSGRRIADGEYAVIDGRVRVSTVPPGRWLLVVKAGDSAATRFVVSAPGDQGRLLLPTGGSLRIDLPELDRVPIADVTLTGPGGKPFISMDDVDFGPGKWLLDSGRTTVSGLMPGDWSFNVRHEDRTWSGTAGVTPGAVTEVTVPSSFLPPNLHQGARTP